MTRVLTLIVGLLTGPLTGWMAKADDPPQKLTPEERKDLEAKWNELNETGLKAKQAGKYPEATKSWEDGLKVARRLYNTTEFPDGHVNLAKSLNNLGSLNQALGRYADAEPLFRDALAIFKRFYKGDHLSVANSLNNLAGLYMHQGKLGAAEPLFKEALAMYQRLFTGDHPAVIQSLINLAGLYKEQGKLAAAEPLFKDALAMHRRLFPGDHNNVARSLNNLAGLYQAQGKLAAAEPLYADALAMRQRLYQGDHPEVALSLNNLAGLYRAQVKLAAAEPLLADALAMYQRLFKGDHPSVVLSLLNLAALYRDQGKYAAAEPHFTEALAMTKRLFKGDHPYIALSLNWLAGLYLDQGKYAAAEPLFLEALAIYKRLFKGDHPFVAMCQNNLADLYRHQGKLAAAEPLFLDVLAMRQRLFKGDNPDVAESLHNLAGLYEHQWKLADAEPLYKDALAMFKRLFPGDHPHVAVCQNNLAGVYEHQGKPAAAEPLYKDALAMYRRLVTVYAEDKTEGETLTLLPLQPLTRDAFLSLELRSQARAATVYPEVWAHKGNIARAYERRQLQARAAAANPETARVLQDLIDARRRRAELLLAPVSKDLDTRDQRDRDTKTYEEVIAARTQSLKALLPSLDRIKALADAQPAALQQSLPADAAVVDYLRFIRFEQDKDKPGKEGSTSTACYLAFVVTKDKVAWLDLGAAEKIESAVLAWREAITGDPARKFPSASTERAAELGRMVRELVWEKVRRELPAGIKTLYICPDATLCKVPFAALSGDKPGTILLEDFAVASIPHAPFLLDKLSPREPVRNPPSGALVVGAVKYDADLHPAAASLGSAASRGDPLLKPGQKLSWGYLDNTAGEASGVAAAAERNQMTAMRLNGDRATTAAVLAALPKAKYAHFATHGFFADESFRGFFQLDPKDYEKGLRGERVGKAALSPLVMTGLVFAGANNPDTPGRGILTGEQLIDLDLSGLELAVLSACETGLGDVAGGEGTFGLQRAFHYAGATNVVASLWKVPDRSTAALMALFYKNLWDRNLSPMESLRQAQLEIYKNPSRIVELAQGFRGQFQEVAGNGDVEIKPSKDGKAHPLLWAAFIMSGPGR